MNKNWTRNLEQFAAAVLALLFAACALPLAAHAQSASTTPAGAGSTIIVATTANGADNLHFSTGGCSGTLSGVGVFVSIDDSCWAWNDNGDIPRSMWVRIVGDKISFRQNGKTYQITDAATVKRVRALFAPIEDLSRQQRELGDQQRALGQKQRDLGEQQREVKVQVPDMSADFAKVEADAKRLNAEGGTQSELGDLQSELGDLQSRLGDLQSQAGEMQSKLGDKQSVLGDQQSALGDKQSALGDRESEMSGKVARQLKDLLDQSISSGSAKPE
jgi:predicted  nucleic acid-binding Zn-ribbon protein